MSSMQNTFLKAYVSDLSFQKLDMFMSWLILNLFLCLSGRESSVNLMYK